MKSEGGVVNEAFLEQHKRFHLCKESQHRHFDSVNCNMHFLQILMASQAATGRLSIPAFIQNSIQGRALTVQHNSKHQCHVSKSEALQASQRLKLTRFVGENNAAMSAVVEDVVDL